MPKRIQDKNCCLCGEPGGTREHFPPKDLWRDQPLDSWERWTVPTCHNCQKVGYDKEVSAYFAWMVRSGEPAIPGLRDSVNRNLNSANMAVIQQCWFLMSHSAFEPTKPWRKYTPVLYRKLNSAIEKWSRCAAHKLYQWNVVDEHCCFGIMGNVPSFPAGEYRRKVFNRGEVVLDYYKAAPLAYLKWTLFNQYVACAVVGQGVAALTSIASIRRIREESDVHYTIDESAEHELLRHEQRVHATRMYDELLNRKRQQEKLVAAYKEKHQEERDETWVAAASSAADQLQECNEMFVKLSVSRFHTDVL